MHFARQRLWWADALFAVLLGIGAPINVVAKPAAPADTLQYVVQAGDTLIKICSSYRSRTHHYALGDLLHDVRQANGLTSNFLYIGQALRLPVCAEAPGEAVPHTVQDGAEFRGMYLTGPACGVSSVLGRVDRFIAAGGNAVVFDAKDIDGGVSFYSRDSLAVWGGERTAPVISSLSGMMAQFGKRGLYSVARIALFLDGELGSRRPDLALRDTSGTPWMERGCVWLDPARPEVRAYNLALAVELAQAGVDEVQFDYLRYPTNGWSGSDGGITAQQKCQVINGFLREARVALVGYHVKISADLYGIMAWGREADLALTGQHVPTIASLVDVVCPMIYPSHFGAGFAGHKCPADAPEYFVGDGTRRFRELVAGRAEVRPWLQAFPYRVSHFDGQYVQVEFAAARAAGGNGWCLWNPSCRYTVAMDAMQESAQSHGAALISTTAVIGALIP